MGVCQDAVIVKNAIRRVPTTMEATALKRRLVPPPRRPRRRRPRLPLQRLPLRAECCRLSIVCKPPSPLRLQVDRPDRLGLQKPSTSITLRGAIRNSFHCFMESLTHQRHRPRPECLRPRQELHRGSPVDPRRPSHRLRRIDCSPSSISRDARVGTAPPEWDQEEAWGTDMAERVRRHPRRSLA